MQNNKNEGGELFYVYSYTPDKVYITKQKSNKLELLEGVNKGAKTYYKSIKNLAVEDIVLVSYNEEKIKAKVIRIDKNISSYSCPIPVRRLKEIIKKV